MFFGLLIILVGAFMVFMGLQHFGIGSTGGTANG